MKNKIILFEESNVKLEVNLQDETVWLTQEQISELFERNQSILSRHIKNIFMEGELEEKSNMQKMHIAKSDKPVTIYSLDVIISVGYRVKSKNGVKFRKWANKILKEYLIKGYNVNNQRLQYLEKTIKLIDIATRTDEGVKTDEGYAMLKVISEYTKALDILDKYDHQELVKPKGSKQNEIKNIEYEKCLDIVNQMCFKETSSIFDIGPHIRSILFNIYNCYIFITHGNLHIICW